MVKKCEDVSHDNEDWSWPNLDQITNLDDKFVFRFQLYNKKYNKDDYNLKRTSLRVNINEQKISSVTFLDQAVHLFTTLSGIK
jgi:hypothetical protein